MTLETVVRIAPSNGPRLLGKSAIITGSAQGIGLAVAELFCREGAQVVLVDIDGARAETEAGRLAAAGADAIGLKADVAGFADCEAAVATCLGGFGKVDILVNNAGITRDNLLLRMTEADWDLVLDVNLKGAFNLTKAALRPMLKARWGRIVNIASVVGQEGGAGQANYAASKGGLIAFTKSCAREVASRGILVNAVAPGAVRTRMTDAVPQEVRERTIAKIPLGRLAEPVEIAQAVLFLASPESSYITGQCLGVNGGVYL
ncbi:MAG: 3-oxoacyl-acyl-carrier protein reductase [Elusimicrobia bacterium]|nr:MAG: 3-oxoacyl-acyl-carrier protein reductase [Elusimicrobiota bacterium]